VVVNAKAGASPAPELSIVVPVYNCAGTLAALVERVTRALDDRWRPAEWIFVDDASEDGAWPILADLAAAAPNLRAYRLARNAGQHAAITFGLGKATGRFCAVMDCDLQDPPEELPRLLRLAGQGHDIVVATCHRRTRRGWRGVASRLYRWILAFPARGAFELTMYSVLSRHARDAFLRSRRAGRAYLLVLLALGIPVTTLESYRDARPRGGSSYTPRKLLTTGLRNALLFRPLRVAGLLATVVVVSSGAILLAFGGRAAALWVAASIALCAGLLLAGAADILLHGRNRAPSIVVAEARND
jgi:dolichol-phosphate mannosyltransferase